MKGKLLFLLQFLGWSILLFAFGRQLLHGYASALGRTMKVIEPSYAVPPTMEHFLYGSSMIIIAFIALVLSMPAVPALKRVLIAAIGLAAFFLADLLFIQFGIFPHGRPSLTEDSPIFELYLCTKWLLPFIFWLAMKPPLFGRLMTALSGGEQRVDQ